MSAEVIAGAQDVRRDSTSGWIRVKAGTWRWMFRPEVFGMWKSRLESISVDDWPGAVIKCGPHRTVRRLELAGCEFYLKQFHLPDWRTRLRHLLRRSQAYWEWSRYRLAVRRGVPTADVVAIAHQATWGGESGLITRGLNGAAPLDQWLIHQPHLGTVSVRRRIAERLGQLVGRMHRLGVTHIDFHAGNILVQQQADTWKFWIVDLSPLRFRSSPAGLSECGQNLGRLRHSLLRHLHPTDDAAFFAAYWDELQSGNRRVGRVFEAHQSSDRRSIDLVERRSPRQERSSRHAVMRTLSLRCDAVAKACWKQMDRKWARGNRKTIRIDLPNVHCRGLATCGESALNSLCDAPETLLFLPNGTRVSWAGRSLHLRSESSDPGWARRAWETGHALERRLIRAPVPAFYLEQHQPQGNRELLALLDEPDWQPLTSLFSRNRAPDFPAILRELGQRIAVTLKRFHELGFRHEQLTVAAWEIRLHAQRWQVRLASLESIRQAGSDRPERRWGELRTLFASLSDVVDISRTHWLRWLRRYLQGAEWARWKVAWKAVSLGDSPSVTHRAA